MSRCCGDTQLQIMRPILSHNVFPLKTSKSLLGSNQLFNTHLRRLHTRGRSQQSVSPLSSCFFLLLRGILRSPGEGGKVILKWLPLCSLLLFLNTALAARAAIRQAFTLSPESLRCGEGRRRGGIEEQTSSPVACLVCSAVKATMCVLVKVSLCVCV